MIPLTKVIFLNTHIKMEAINLKRECIHCFKICFFEVKGNYTELNFMLIYTEAVE